MPEQQMELSKRVKGERVSKREREREGKRRSRRKVREGKGVQKILISAGEKSEMKN